MPVPAPYARSEPRTAPGPCAANALAISVCSSISMKLKRLEDRLGHKLNLARFFTVIGVLLMIFAAGLLADAVENLQQLGWLPVLAAPMWHSASLLSESSSFGDVLHSFFGYSDAPTPLQLVVYAGYLVVVVVAFLGVRARMVRRAASPHPVQ